MVSAINLGSSQNADQKSEKMPGRESLRSRDGRWGPIIRLCLSKILKHARYCQKPPGGMVIEQQAKIS